MDAERFDGVTRRATALGAVGFVAGLLGAAAGRDAAAKKKGKKKCPKCRGRGQGANCIRPRDCCANETGLSCGPARGGEPGIAVCCGTRNVACGGDGDCCEGFTCIAGRCEILAP